MCNIDTFRWAANNLKEEEIKGKRVLEVGSYDVNGSLRCIIMLLKPNEYIGVDIVEGPGVDMVCPAEKLVAKFGQNSFDAVISTCTLEHIKDWKSSISNIKQLCKKNGIILIAVPSQWPFHEHPSDYWRYTSQDLKNIFSDLNILKLEEDKAQKSLVYLKAQKSDNFKENNLSDYQLYSVIAGGRVDEITDKHLHSLRFKYLTLKHKFLLLLIKIGRIIFSGPN